MEITFIGAARTVTGSLYLLEHQGQKFIMECGLYQGHREDAERINRTFPFKPREIKAALLSHGHIDHSGNLPGLVKRGFTGNIFCTPATADITALLLMDTARIQEYDVAYFNKKQKAQNLPSKEALYDLADVEHTTRRFAPINYHSAYEPVPGVRATFFDAGHILGSAQILLEVDDKRILFTGDLGRKGMPIINDPEMIEDIDYLIMESTYGNRVHKSFSEMLDELRSLIQQGRANNSKIIVPAFAVERTQLLINMLKDLAAEGILKDIPVYVDSPLASSVTEVFNRHPECFDPETYAEFSREDPFDFPTLQYIKDTEASKKLNSRPGPMIIVAGSGMCEGGRVVHHLIHSISDRKNMVIITGFQAAGTLGKKILDGLARIPIYNEMYEVNAQVHFMSGLSAHGDFQDLVQHARNKPRLKKVFLVHGDVEQAGPLRDKLMNSGIPVDIPQSLTQVIL